MLSLVVVEYLRLDISQKTTLQSSNSPYCDRYSDKLSDVVFQLKQFTITLFLSLYSDLGVGALSLSEMVIFRVRPSHSYKSPQNRLRYGSIHCKACIHASLVLKMHKTKSTREIGFLVSDHLSTHTLK